MRAALICFLFAATAAGAAERVHSLDQLPSALKTPEGKAIVAEQMAGKPTPDQLGLKLPPGLTSAQIAALVLPPGLKAPLNAVGAKPLAARPDSYIAIVCVGGDIPTGPDDSRCAESSDDGKPKLQAYIALLEAKPGAAPHLLAKPVHVDGMVDWRHTDLPTTPDALDDAKGDAIAPAKIDGFDLAPYKIAPNQPAYGLRGSWSDSYSGGMGAYTALYLFAVENGALKRVLAVPMSAYKDIAGDWHKDGTRDHEVTDTANVLLVSSHITNGHFELTLRSRGVHTQRAYRWDAATAAYAPAGK